MKEEILFVKKQSKSPLSTEEVIRTFEMSDNLEEIRSAVENAEERLLVTWASVVMKDKAGEMISAEDLVRSQDILLERNGPITDTHTNKVVGNTLAYKVMTHPVSNTIGVLHLDKIYNHNPADDTVWDQIVTGEKKGSSVGGINTGLSFKIDEVTGEGTKVLEGFHQMETAMVDDPCNPLALNEAFSVVAKSNQRSNTKDVRKGELEKENITKQETDINKLSLQKNTTNTEVDKMSEEFDVKKSISDLTKTVGDMVNSVEKLSEDVAKMKKEYEEDSEDKPEEMEEKKKSDGEEKKPSEEKPSEEKEVSKEQAASDIDGESDAKSPESPVVEDSNDKDVYKKMENLVNKKFDSMKDELLKKIGTPHPTSHVSSEVKKKNDEFANIGLELATGKKRMPFLSVTKAYEEYLDRNSPAGVM